MKKSLIILSILSLIPLTAKAEGIKVSTSVGVQQELFRGWVQYKGTKIDVKDDLQIKDKNKFTGCIDFKIPGKLPNVRIEYLNVKSSGTGTISKSITFGGVTFNVSDTINTRFKADQIDTTFYYTPLKGTLQANVGAGVKYLTGYVDIKSLKTGTYSDTDFDIPVPYVFAETTIKQNLFFGSFSIKGVAYSGNYFYDWNLKSGVSYKNFFADLGYRYQKLHIDDIEDFSSDLKIKGIYGEIGIRF